MWYCTACKDDKKDDFLKGELDMIQTKKKDELQEMLNADLPKDTDKKKSKSKGTAKKSETSSPVKSLKSASASPDRKPICVHKPLSKGKASVKIKKTTTHATVEEFSSASKERPESSNPKSIDGVDSESPDKLSVVHSVGSES